ncbi:MAG: hypothetical protein AB7L71_04475 [Vicinamibacterales bacterium]
MTRQARLHALLDRPLTAASRALLAAGLAALIAGALLPLWRIHLVAPQYREGLSIEMYTYKIVGGNGGQDLAEINTLNHYIGMAGIEPSDFVEMKWIPFAIGVFVLITLRAMVLGRVGSLVDLAAMFGYFGAFSLASFAYRLYTYGHNLDPKAPMTIEPFMPVVIGRQQIANFVQSSLPMAGSVCMALYLASILAAIWMSRRAEA